MYRTRATLSALLAITALASDAPAQILRGGQSDTTVAHNGTSRHMSDFARRSSGSVGFSQTRPLGGLARNISFGYGAAGNYVYRLDQAGIVGLRLGGSFSGYGQERFRVPLSYSIGGRVQVDVTTTNTIGTLTVGPELMFPTGWIRPYAHAGGGIIWLATTSSVSGIDDYDNAFSTRNYSDGTPTWTAGGGVHIPLVRKRTSVLLDLGADYYYGGEASYLRKGSIVDNPDGTIQMTSYHSETRFLNVSFGARITP